MSGRWAGPVVNRLLGPGGPEVTCETCFDELDRFVELELSGTDADAALPGMRGHLRGCPACAEEYESLRYFVGSRHADAASGDVGATGTSSRPHPAAAGDHAGPGGPDGGEPACLLAQVCPDCGRLAEELDPQVCGNCGHTFAAD